MNDIFVPILISLGMGFLFAIISASSKKRDLNNVHKAINASTSKMSEVNLLYENDKHIGSTRTKM